MTDRSGADWQPDRPTLRIKAPRVVFKAVTASFPCQEVPGLEKDQAVRAQAVLREVDDVPDPVNVLLVLHLLVLVSILPMNQEYRSGFYESTTKGLKMLTFCFLDQEVCQGLVSDRIQVTVSF